MVLKIFYLSEVTIDDRLGELLFARQEWGALLAIPQAVVFNVGFGHHPEAIFIAQLVPSRVIRVVGGADVVDVAPFHHLDVPNHLRLGHGVPGLGFMFVAVHPLQFDGHSVYAQFTAFDLNRTEANPDRQQFRVFAL